MPKVKQLTVLAADRPGVLGRLATALGARKVNIQAHTAYVSGRQGTIRLVVDKPAVARKALAEQGWRCREEDILAVRLPDKPGTLGRIARKLGQAGVNIRYAYTGPARGGGRVNVYLAVPNVARALRRLR
jgi:hypothetical protein